MKYLLVPISVLGCGKSTICRTLCILYPNFAQVENDSCYNARQFYQKIQNATETAWAVFADRNNHLQKHRTDLIERFKTDSVTTVAVLFVPKSMPRQKLFKLCMDRILGRGDNHKTIKGSSEYGKAKMILNRFFKDYAPYDASLEKEGKFDYVLPLQLHENSSLGNVKRIIQFLSEASGGELPIPTDEEIKHAYDAALQYKIDEDKPKAETRAEQPEAKQAWQKLDKEVKKGEHDLALLGNASVQ